MTNAELLVRAEASLEVSSVTANNNTEYSVAAALRSIAASLLVLAKRFGGENEPTV